MTTVCWDGKTMAADKQMNTGNMKHLVARSKIRAGQYHGMPAIFGGAGTTVYSDAVQTKGTAECIVMQSKVATILPQMLGRKPEFYAASCAEVKPFVTAP